MLLLSGPPGSGKTYHVLEQIGESARRGANDVRLLTPTATMAEHLRHQLVRREGILGAGVIQTLHRFLRAFPTDFVPVSRSALRHAVRHCLSAGPPSELRGVSDFPGFQQAVVELVEELAAARIPTHQVARQLSRVPQAPPHASALTELLGRVADYLLERGWLTRGDHVRAVAARIKEDGLGEVRHVLLDGFFTFTEAELELVHSLAEHADLTITLPRWEGSEHTREVLLTRGFEEHVLKTVRSVPEPNIVRAPNQDAEVTEVARRILTEVRAGRRFREIGIVVRGAAPYGPALESALERFGIPARFYFGHRLAGVPAVQRIVRVLDAWHADWDMETLLGAIRLGPASARRDRLDFAIQEKAPAAGLDILAELEGPGWFDVFRDRLAEMEQWRRKKARPEIWAGRLARLPALFPPPTVSDQVTHARGNLWRIHAAALQGFQNALEETRLLFPAGDPVTLEEFWAEGRQVVEEQRFFVRDHRRDVVHVMDAYEARQWELPVVFVCGLTEDEFPRRQSDSPLLPDAARMALRKRGLFLRTSRQREQEEQFLFELALSRGIARTTLSYPAHHGNGNPARASFLLARHRRSLGRDPESDQQPVAVRPASPRLRPSPSPPRIQAEDLLAELRRRHGTLSPSAIELFLSCPFQFFAEKTLKLQPPPPLPSDRLDSSLQGTIVHAVLKELGETSGDLREVFTRVFQRYCRQKKVPAGYQTERIRLEMLRSLEEWCEKNPLRAAAETLHEAGFDMKIAPELSVRGRVDRIEQYSENRALVIDYKYSAGSRLRVYVKETEDDRRVQAGLYMMAARDAFGFTPAGMLYCALRGDPLWDGWLIKGVPAEVEHAAQCLPEVLDEMIDRARAQSIEVAGRIRGGEIEPVPFEEKNCGYCSGQDICRRREAEGVRVAGGGQ